MNSQTLPQNDIRDNIYKLVSTLTSLDPNLKEISVPIEESNALVKKVNIEINQLKTKRMLLKLAILEHLASKLEEYKLEIDTYIQKLRLGKIEAKRIFDDYARVISTLIKLTEQLEEHDQLKADALGIISLNNLKLNNIKNQIEQSESQILALDRFNSITLYHLTDSIKSNKLDHKLQIFKEISRVIENLKSKNFYCICTSFFVFALLAYNHMATNYYMVLDRLNKTIVNNGIHAEVATLNDTSSLASQIVTVGSVIGMILVIAGGFRILASSFEEISFSTIALGIGISASSVLFGHLLEGSVNETSTAPVYIEKIITEKYEFTSLGATGSISLLILLLAIFLLKFWYQNQFKQYSVVLDKISTNINTNMLKEPKA